MLRSVRPKAWMFVLTLHAACATETNPSASSCGDPERGPAFDGFSNRTGTSGISFDYSTTDFKGGGLAVADLDGDDLVDIAAGSRGGGVGVFRNRGKLRFEEVARSGLDPVARVTAMAAADLDNDGDRDLIVAGHGSTRIFANRGDATFDEAVALENSGTTEHVLPVDLDNDGLLDLYVGNYDLTSLLGTSNRLYRNRGSLQFDLVKIDGAGRTWTTTAWDYDDDGDQDLYVANDTLAVDFGAGPVNALAFPVDAFLRNDGTDERGAPQFTDIAIELGMTEPRSSMGGIVEDFDGDGALDLYIPNFGANKLFVRAAETSGYAERAGALGLAAIRRVNARCDETSTSENCLLLSWSTAVSDFDLDGHDEVLLVNGSTMIGGAPPVQLFSRDGVAFREMSPNIPCADARALVTTDLDADGDQDIVMAPKLGALTVFENTRHPSLGSSLTLRLRGTTSNRDGIGAEVTVRHESGRERTKIVGAGGVIHSFGPAEVFFGVDAGDPLREVRIRWPGGERTVDPVDAGTGAALQLVQP